MQVDEYVEYVGENDLSLIKDAIEGLNGAEDTRKVGVILSILGAAMAFNASPATDDSHETMLSPSEIEGLCEGTLSVYVGMACAANGIKEEDLDWYLENIAYATMSMSVFMQIAAKSMHPEDFDYTNTTVSFLQRVQEEVLKNIQSN